MSEENKRTSAGILTTLNILDGDEDTTKATDQFLSTIYQLLFAVHSAGSLRVVKTKVITGGKCIYYLYVQAPICLIMGKLLREDVMAEDRELGRDNLLEVVYLLTSCAIWQVIVCRLLGSACKLLLAASKECI